MVKYLEWQGLRSIKAALRPRGAVAQWVVILLSSTLLVCLQCMFSWSLSWSSFLGMSNLPLPHVPSLSVMLANWSVGTKIAPFWCKPLATINPKTRLVWLRLNLRQRGLHVWENNNKIPRLTAIAQLSWGPISFMMSRICISIRPSLCNVKLLESAFQWNGTQSQCSGNKFWSLKA